MFFKEEKIELERLKENALKEANNLTLAKERLVAERAQFKLEMEVARLNAQISEESDIKRLNEKICSLEADLKIEKAKSAKIEAEQKSKYAEHVMAVTDERVKEMKSIYEGYAKNLTDVVKAAHTGAATHVTNTVKA